MGSVVLTAQPMRSDSEKIGRHMERVHGQPNLRARSVGPVHRDFGHSVASSAGHHLHLDIEADPVHPHALEEVMRHPGAKQLEPTLGVLHACIGKPLDESMEGASNEMTVGLRVHSDALRPERARADRHIRA